MIEKDHSVSSFDDILEKDTDNLLAAMGLVVSPIADEVKKDERYNIVSIKEENRIMETKKNPFSLKINDDTYTVARGYRGTDGRIHVLPSDTVLVFVKKTADGKVFPLAEVKKDGSSWNNQVFELILLNSKKNDGKNKTSNKH